MISKSFMTLKTPTLIIRGTLVVYNKTNKHIMTNKSNNKIKYMFHNNF